MTIKKKVFIPNAVDFSVFDYAQNNSNDIKTIQSQNQTQYKITDVSDYN